MTKKYATEEERLRARRASAKRWYDKNVERHREGIRRWRKENPERARELSAAWRERNKELARARGRRQYEQNREYWRRRYEERRELYAERARRWKEKNPGRFATYRINRRARLLAGGVHTTEEWLAKAAAFGGCCAYCRRSGQMTRDHVIPLTRGGPNGIDNIVPACGRCNSRKGTMTGEEFMARLAEDKCSPAA